MTQKLHLNLINENEILSSGPVRMHVLIPVLMIALTIGVGLWWFFLYLNYSFVKGMNTQKIEINKQLQPGYQAVQELNKQEKKLQSLINQLQSYKQSKLGYGEVFNSIPQHVMPNIQFTKLELLPPPPPLFAKDKEVDGPTNTVEQTAFLITGRTTGANAVDSVEKLLVALQGDAYTNLIRRAHIPLNAIRPENNPRSENKEFLRFEIKCECQFRRFE